MKKQKYNITLNTGISMIAYWDEKEQVYITAGNQRYYPYEVTHCVLFND